MVNKKISELPTGAAVVDADLVPIVQSGNTVKVPVSSLGRRKAAYQVSLLDFCDGTEADVLFALNAAHTALPARGGTIDIPPNPNGADGEYAVSDKWVISKPTVITGSGSGYLNTSPIKGAAVLAFAAGKGGIEFVTGSQRSVVQNLTSRSKSTAANTGNGVGILIKSPEVTLDDVLVYGFGSHGIMYDALDPANDANLGRALHVKSYSNFGDGLRIRTGANGANGITIVGFNAFGNTGWGIWNNGASNRFLCPHTNGNIAGAYHEEGTASIWEWVYAEQSVTWNFDVALNSTGHYISVGNYAVPTFYYNGVLGGVGVSNLLQERGVWNNFQVGGDTLPDTINSTFHVDKSYNINRGAFKAGKRGNYIERLAWYKSADYGGNVTIPELAPGASHTFSVTIHASDPDVLAPSRDVVMGCQLSATGGLTAAGVRATAHITSGALTSNLTFVVTNHGASAVFAGGVSSLWLVSVLQTA